MNWDSSDNWDNSGKYTLTDARRLWMVWWNRNQPDLLNLRAKHHAEGQRAFQSLLAEARADLRTDEAVERVANALCVEEEGMTLAEHEANCELPVCGFRQSFLADARRNITALLGEEP